jgi:hypothetical protein
MMHDLDGLSITEVAQQMRVSLATASARVQAARRACAKALRRRETVDGFRSTQSALALLWTLPGPRPLPPVRARWRMAGGGLLVAAAIVVVSVGARARHREAASASSEPAPTPPRAPWRRAPVMAPPATTPAGTLDEGLIGDWRLDEAASSGVAIDRSTSANDCVLHGLGPAARIAGRYGGGLHVGTQGWLECPHAEAIARLDHEMTVSAWIRPVSMWGTQTIAARQEDHGRPDQFFFGLVNSQLSVNSRVWRRRLYATLPPIHDAWIHVAFTRHADGVVALFAGGARIAESRGRPTFSLGGGKGALTIGGGLNGRDRHDADELFAGDLDEVLIYDRALSGAEIALLANGARPE